MYRIYCRFPFQFRFLALDLTQGSQVLNLIRASILSAEELQIFIKNHAEDKGYQLQFRKIGNSKKTPINYKNENVFPI